MGKLTTDDVNHVAELAKLKLTSGEKTKFQKELSEIVNYVSELSDVDTSGIDPTSQTTGLENIFRSDVAHDSEMNQESALSGSEKVHNGYFVVPQILDKEDR